MLGVVPFPRGWWWVVVYRRNGGNGGFYNARLGVVVARSAVHAGMVVGAGLQEERRERRFFYRVASGGLLGVVPFPRV